MKRVVEDLALFGGPPFFAEVLHVGRPNVGDPSRLHQRIDEILDSRRLTNNGPFVREFETRVSERVGRHCVAVGNGTLGLQLAARALELSGEVIIPSLTFIATAHALEWGGLSPVFCDVDPDTHTIDPHLVEALITPRTSAIVGVHLWGRPCAVEPLVDIARRRGLKLIFDAAHAFACTYRGQEIGGFGDAEVFSFHATKFVNCGEGGAITTGDDLIADRLRAMRDFGFIDYDRVGGAGINARMNEFSAAMGLTSLEQMNAVIEVNRRAHRRYQAALDGLPGLRVVSYDPAERANYQYAVVDLHGAPLSRDEIVDVLWAENVLARRYFYPGCHRVPPYVTRSTSPPSLPVTESIVSRLMALPTGPAVTETAHDGVCHLIQFALEHADEVRQRLPAAR